MIAKENQVYVAAMQFCRIFSKLIPEAVIYGYAKLLSMDENQIRNFVSEDCMNDLEGAHKWFSDNKLDLNLIKSGLLYIVSIIPQSKVSEKQNEFNNFLESEEKKTGSKDILQKALECAFVSFTTVFAEGNELQSVFNYQEDIKQKYSSEQEKKQNDSNKKIEEEVENTEPSLDELEEKMEEEKTSSIVAESKEKKEVKEGTLVLLLHPIMQHLTYDIF